MRRLLSVMVGLLLVSCSADDGPALDENRCRAPAGVDASPGTIEEALTLIDSLPRPVTVACVIESLERPMTIIGSYDVFSAQPSAGMDAPRIFAIYDRLILSFVPDGDGSHVLEFAEERPGNLSIKAELLMPIEAELDPADAFGHIKRDSGEGTTCGNCHGREELAQDIDWAEAYVSEALRPATSEVARVEDMKASHAACDAKATPRRCEIYDAIFGFGAVEDGDFPRPLPTIYD